MIKYRTYSWIELVRMVDKEVLEPYNDDYGRNTFIPPNRAKQYQKEKGKDGTRKK